MRRDGGTEGKPLEPACAHRTVQVAQVVGVTGAIRLPLEIRRWRTKTHLPSDYFLAVDVRL